MFDSCWLVSIKCTQDLGRLFLGVNINRRSHCLHLVLTFSLSACDTTAQVTEPKLIPEEFLKADAPNGVPGKPGHFDFMNVDLKRDRLLAAHPADHPLVVYDLKKNRLLKSVEVGEVQGVGVDDRSGTYVLGDAGEHKVVFLKPIRCEYWARSKSRGPSTP